jgi:hypothetical protein
MKAFVYICLLGVALVNLQLALAYPKPNINLNSETSDESNSDENSSTEDIKIDGKDVLFNGRDTSEEAKTSIESAKSLSNSEPIESIKSKGALAENSTDSTQVTGSITKQANVNTVAVNNSKKSTEDDQIKNSEIASDVLIKVDQNVATAATGYSAADILLNSPFNLKNLTGPKDLYVIKTIVYEVGVLTDAANNTSNNTDNIEEVDLKFYNRPHNGSTIELDNIPVPIRANVSGLSISGVVPVDFGDVTIDTSNPNGTQLVAPLLPNAIVSISHNVTTINQDSAQGILDNLPEFLGLTPS